MVREMFLNEVQSIRVYWNDWKNRIPAIKIKKRVILLKYKFIWCEGYKNSMPMLFNINTWLITNNNNTNNNNNSSSSSSSSSSNIDRL